MHTAFMVFFLANNVRPLHNIGPFLWSFPYIHPRHPKHHINNTPTTTMPMQMKKINIQMNALYLK